MGGCLKYLEVEKWVLISVVGIILEALLAIFMINIILFMYNNNLTPSTA